MDFEKFQQVVSRSDPRAALLFQCHLDEILPHIVVLSREMQSQVVMVPKHGSLGDVFHAALDNGQWIVVESMSAASFDEWRNVGSTLATVLPSASYQGRKQFRLFSFVQGSSPNLRLFAPALFCQFAILVDNEGGLLYRSDLSPIFGGVSSFSEHALDSLAGNPENGRADPHQSASELRRKVAAALEARAPATHIDYIDETLCALREELEERQKRIVDSVPSQVEEAVAEDLEKQTTLQDATLSSMEDSQNQAARRRALIAVRVKEQVEHDYDWIFSRILEWSICQCPDVEAIGVAQISPDEIELVDTAWKGTNEVCHFGSWGGCPVLVKVQLHTLSTSLSENQRALFRQEAARHYPLRHPRIVEMFGLSSDRIVIENCIGTLEQHMMKRRGSEQRVSLRAALLIAKHVLEGLAFLSDKALIHRDISCRCILESPSGEFKIGQFQCSTPRMSPEGKDNLLPVRWTSPEGFLGSFSEKSDIWSFGVLMWEVATYCSLLPYSEHVQAANAILKGIAIEQPYECPDLLWSEIISPCFSLEADTRPSARQLLVKVERALNKWPHLGMFLPLPEDRKTFEVFNEC